MTEAATENARLFFVRRGQKVVGPYPSRQIQRYVTLGRIVESDELSIDKETWQPLAGFPDLHRALHSNDEARGREDERAEGDRRDRQEPPPQEILNRRNGGERRQQEAEELQRHRAMKSRLLKQMRSRSDSYWLGSVVLGVMLVAIILASVRFAPQVDEINVLPACETQAAAGVNWDNCRLDGLAGEAATLTGASLRNTQLRSASLHGAQLQRADLSYADLSSSDLSHALLSGGRLKGATLRNADLTYANLAGADLSYADLKGANLGGADLDGAVLDHAMWLDGSVCGAGSLGGCRR